MAVGGYVGWEALVAFWGYKVWRALVAFGCGAWRHYCFFFYYLNYSLGGLVKVGGVGGWVAVLWIIFPTLEMGRALAVFGGRFSAFFLTLLLSSFFALALSSVAQRRSPSCEGGEEAPDAPAEVAPSDISPNFLRRFASNFLLRTAFFT